MKGFYSSKKRTRRVLSFLHENFTASFCSSLYPYARCHTKGGCYGSNYGYHYLDNLSSNAFVVFVVAHNSLVF